MKHSNIVETIFDFVKSAEENDLSRKTIEDEIYEELMKLNLHFVEEPEPEDLILSRRISLDIKDSLEIHHKKIKSKYSIAKFNRSILS